MKHTTEKLVVKYDNSETCQWFEAGPIKIKFSYNNDDSGVIALERINHIASCVNSCADINPEAVPEMVKLCNEIINGNKSFEDVVIMARAVVIKVEKK